MTTTETFEHYEIEVKPTGSKLQKTKCPNCHHLRKNKADKSLSVNREKGIWNCHYCGWKGVLKTSFVEKKQFTNPQTPELPLSAKTIDWFISRGILETTLQYFKVTESLEWMPAKGEVKEGKRTCVNFNYYRDGVKVNVKYRDAAKNFRLVKDAELILYNQDALKERTDMLICEGEIDCMTFYQSGHYGAVSVPNGASKGNAKLEYLDNCWPVFEKMEKIIIATDGDQAGSFLRDELIRRLGKHRCWLVEYPEGCKDANEVQLKYGLNAVTQLWQSAQAPPLESVHTIEDIEPDLNHIFEHGWPKGDTTEIDDLDSKLLFAPGEITTITGIPQHGKGKFLDEILVNLSALHGRKHGVFSYEEPSVVKTTILAQKYVGRPFYRKDKTMMMSSAQRDAAYKFLNAHFFFIDIRTADLTLDGILNKGRELVLRKGINTLVIDPYNCIESNRSSFQSETEYVSEIMSKIKRFAVSSNVHVFLVAHPTKMKKENGKYLVPTLYDIAGSANFFNKTDNGLTVYRNYEDNTTDVYIQKVKFFYNGELGMIKLSYDLDTCRYAALGLPFRPALDLQLKFNRPMIGSFGEMLESAPF